jgi:hypothetical protein
MFNVVQNKAIISRTFSLYNHKDGSVEKWHAIAYEYSGNEWLDGELGNNSSHVKKWTILCLGGNQYLWQIMECYLSWLEQKKSNNSWSCVG